MRPEGRLSLAEWMSWVHPDDRDNSEASLQACLQDPSRDVWEQTYRMFSLPANAYCYCLERGYVVRDAAGTAVRMIGSLQDIDQSTRLHLRLEQAYQELKDYKSALDQSTNIIFTDANGVILDANQSTCDLSGYSREELLGRHTRINRSGYHPRSFYKQLWNTITQGHTWRGELKNRRKDGSTYWVDTLIVPLLDATGQPHQYLAVRIDITEKKEAEEKRQQFLEQLSQANERFEKVTEATQDAIWDWDLASGQLYRGQGFERLSGDTLQAEADGMQTWQACVHPDDWETFEKNLVARLESKDTRQFQHEYRFRRADGTYATVIDRCVIIRTADGKAQRIIGALHDVSRERTYLHTIKQQNARLREIAWTQSHVVRAPLARIMALVDLIEGQALSTEETSDYLRYILQSAHELDTIVRELSGKAAEVTAGLSPFSSRQAFSCLLVDDDPIVLKIHRRVLQNARFHPEPQALAQARVALEFLQANQDPQVPALIFLDINMPDMNGWEFLEALGELFLRQEVWVCVTSSSTDPADQARAFSYPQVVAYFAKPLRPEHLAQLAASAPLG